MGLACTWVYLTASTLSQAEADFCQCGPHAIPVPICSCARMMSDFCTCENPIPVATGTHWDSPLGALTRHIAKSLPKKKWQGNWKKGQKQPQHVTNNYYVHFEYIYKVKYVRWRSGCIAYIYIYISHKYLCTCDMLICWYIHTYVSHIHMMVAAHALRNL